MGRRHVRLHALGGSSIDVQGDRAVAQTRMQITQRGKVHGVPVDVVCQGRFWDALETFEGRWPLVLRQPIYELDRMVPVGPGAHVALEADLLASFPEGHRYLAYLQTEMGFDVRRELPGARGPALDALLAAGLSWLAGGSLDTGSKP